MKTRTQRLAGIFILAFLTFCLGTLAQRYTYTLSGDFQGQPSSAPDLIPIPNNSGATGYFVQRDVPVTTCGEEGIALGYYFEDDAGLKFDNPSGFIDQAYSIAFNFQIDEFISPPPWVRILSFTHGNDVGIYIKLTNHPDNGTLDFWPNGTVGTPDFFSPVDFYQIILVRDTAGLIKIYVNGSEFAEYDDSQSQAYVPQPPNNNIVWFRDDPSVLANEASPGFVSDIIISNNTWTPLEVQEVWDEFCSRLQDISEFRQQDFRLYPNPVQTQLGIEMQDEIVKYDISFLDVTGQVIFEKSELRGSRVFNVSWLHPGIYFLKIQTGDQTQVSRFIKQ